MLRLFFLYLFRSPCSVVLYVRDFSYICTSLLSFSPSSLLCVCSSVFLVCPMKNVPLVVKRRDDQYRHTPLPTDGEVMSVYMFVYILLPNYLCVFRERREKASGQNT